MNKEKLIHGMRQLPFLLVSLMALLLALATFVEKSQGTAYAYAHIYGSWWFSALWAVLVLGSFYGLVKGKNLRNLPLLLLHISFAVILFGALLTKLFGTQGHVVLQQNQPLAHMQTETGQEALPFEIELDSFYVQYYPGTDAPADYVSELSIHTSNEGSQKARISMNNILSQQGYRFYQSSFEDDGKTSILTVNKDIWGIPFTYAGYALFGLAMLWYLFSAKNNFRKILAHPLLKSSLVVLLLLAPNMLKANVLTKDSLTVNEAQANKFSSLWILYEGRICPMASFAHDFTLKLTGKTRFSYMSANQFLMGVLFMPEKWKRVALFEVTEPELQSLLNATSSKAAYSDFFDEHGNYKLVPYYEAMSKSGSKSSKIKELEKLHEKIQLINMLHSGNLLRIFPHQTKNKELQWLYPTQSLPVSMNKIERMFVLNILTEYYQALHAGNENLCSSILQNLNTYQQKKAGSLLPNPTKKTLELFYLKYDSTKLLYKVNLTLGLLALLSFFIFNDKRRIQTQRIFFVLLALSFLLHSTFIGIRTYIGGELPLSNGFETMLVIAWCGMLLGMVFQRKMPLMLAFAFLVSGAAMLVAHLGMMNPKLSPLVPVLSSPLLSIHVSVIMIAYTLLAFAALNSLVALLQIVFSKIDMAENTVLQLERNKLYNLVCLYPALMFLGCGIFIGAIWANVSWGRYWAWDPKEVWALITFLVYSLVFHENKIVFLAKPLWFHSFILLAFSTVLMTYFGVNYYLGGMHSYAGEGKGLSLFWIAVSFGIISLIIFLANNKLRKIDRQ